MLQSQITISARNIPQHVPAIIRRAEKLPPCRFERWGEDAIRRFSEIDARACNAKMIGGGSWHHVHNGREACRIGKTSGHRAAIMAYMTAQGDWRSRAQIVAATGIDAEAVANALYTLTVKNMLTKRILENGSAGNNRLGQWIISKRSMLLDWEKPKTRTNRQIAQLACTNDWQTTNRIAAMCGLSKDKAYKALSSLAASDILEKRKIGEGFDVEIEWRRVGAERAERESASRRAVIAALQGDNWVTTPEVARRTGFKKGQAASQLSRLYSLKRIDRRSSLINGRHTMEWKLTEGEA
jgi:hypothetical protein